MTSGPSKPRESSRGSAEPVHLPLDRPLTPLEALRRLEGLPGRVLLESVPPWGGRSVLGAAPQLVVRGRVGAGRVWAATWVEGLEPADGLPTGALARLGALLDATTRSPGAPRAPGGEGGEGGGVRPGAWIGFLGYELAGEIEPLLGRPPLQGGAPGSGDPGGNDGAEGTTDASAGSWPDLWFGAFDWLLDWPDGPGVPPRLSGSPLPGDEEAIRLRRRMDAVARLLGDPTEIPASANERRRLLDLARGEALLPRGEERVAPAATPPSGHAPLPANGNPHPPRPLAGWPHAGSSLSREEYVRRVSRIREYIRAGDLFQANLTCQVTCPFPAASSEPGGLLLYQALRERSPSPFAGYLEVDGAALVSVSPECFLELRSGRLRTRPIKGTRPRDVDPDRDAALVGELAASEKDRAENVMIVDLLRNDLSRIAKPNSVSVSGLLTLESHPTVHHLVSTVEATLREGVRWQGILEAVFPGGSITGAPKIRAMEVLRELEPVPRGPYTGAIGFVGFDGDASLSIAIRTARVGGGWASYGSGGGVTLASDPGAEWDEMLDKARAFLEVTAPRSGTAGPGGQADSEPADPGSEGAPSVPAGARASGPRGEG